jgi:hypothetical protein
MRSLVGAWVLYLVLLLGTALVAEVFVSTRDQAGYEFEREHRLGGEQFDSILNRHYPENRQLASDRTQSSPLTE